MIDAPTLQKLRELASKATPDVVEALRYCVHVYVATFYMAPDGSDAKPKPDSPVMNAVDSLDVLHLYVPVLLDRVGELERQRDAARTAARKLAVLICDLGAFVDDDDPRIRPLAGPIGEAQADLWIALGMNCDEEHARQLADIESRCAVCGWPLKERVEQGCVRGNCSMRPRPEHLYAPERAAKESQ